jgi:hypothetical protein
VIGLRFEDEHTVRRNYEIKGKNLGLMYIGEVVKFFYGDDNFFRSVMLSVVLVVVSLYLLLEGTQRMFREWKHESFSDVF